MGQGSHRSQKIRRLRCAPRILAFSCLQVLLLEVVKGALPTMAGGVSWFGWNSLEGRRLKVGRWSWLSMIKRMLTYAHVFRWCMMVLLSLRFCELFCPGCLSSCNFEGPLTFLPCERKEVSLSFFSISLSLQSPPILTISSRSIKDGIVKISILVLWRFITFWLIRVESGLKSLSQSCFGKPLQSSPIQCIQGADRCEPCPPGTEEIDGLCKACATGYANPREASRCVKCRLANKN